MSPPFQERIEAIRDEAGQLRLHWGLIENRRAWRDAREGAYLLRTTLVGQTVEELWTKYLQLTEAEAAPALARDGFTRFPHHTSEDYV